MGIFFLGISLLWAQHQHDPKMHAQHHDKVDERGDKVMGFSHDKTTHRFVDTADGGYIEATAKSKSDRGQIGAIRKHFQAISERFPAGDFAMPIAIHGKLPEGAAAMKAGGKAIAYRYEELGTGARLHMSTKEAKLKNAIQKFMAFQRDEHRAH